MPYRTAVLTLGFCVIVVFLLSGCDTTGGSGSGGGSSNGEAPSPGQPLPPDSDAGAAGPDEPSLPSDPEPASPLLEASWQIIVGVGTNGFVASGFAISSQYLGTNAHVVTGMPAFFRDPMAFAVAVQHETHRAAWHTQEAG